MNYQNMPDCFKRIEAFNQGRFPDMLRVKYKLMRDDAFRFFRGTNHFVVKAFSLTILERLGQVHPGNPARVKNLHRIQMGL